ncbi:MAG TPA: type IV toxin-antitoxin system AbiEi family antitoxin domain-containing protein [Myxococcaceae bacterium]|nr:type IV toxin-antitoxin system AbiEi family antitoxin domain-containing protein [Myxococcaceae bacterium]
MGKNIDSRAADLAAAMLAAQQHGLITRAQALALGMSSAGVQRRARSGRWELLRRGVYCFAGTPKTRRRDILEACLGAGDGALASGFTAAEVLRLPDVWSRDHINLSVPPRVRRSARGATIAATRFIRAADDRATCDGIPVTSVARTYVDLAVHLPVHVLERSIVQAVRTRLVTPEQLEAAVARGGAREAIDAIREILAAKAWQDVFRSDGEVRAVQLLRQAGFDDVRTNVELHYAGIRVGEADVFLPEVDMVVEIDGPIDHSTARAKGRDKVRRLAYRAMGLRVVEIHPNRLRDAGDFANQVARELRRPPSAPVASPEFLRLWAGWVEKYGDPNESRAEPRRRSSPRQNANRHALA